MKLFHFGKDGGPHSTVHGLFIIEIKSLFSIVLLRFSDKSREAYHSHAFNAISWVLKGKLIEQLHNTLNGTRLYRPSFKPIITKVDTMHKVDSVGNTYALSFRGPWHPTWREYLPKEDRFVTLSKGRKEVTE